MRNLRNPFKRYYIGDKPVKPYELTIAKYKELTGAVGALPQLIVQTVMAPKEQRLTYGLAAFEASLDDWCRVISVLTEIEYEYVRDHATLSQVTAFINELLRLNNFDEIVKNVKGVLALLTGIGQDAETSNEK